MAWTIPLNLTLKFAPRPHPSQHHCLQFVPTAREVENHFTWLSFSPFFPLEKDDFVWLADDFFPSNVFIDHMKVLSYVSLRLHSALNWITIQRMLQ